LLAKTNERSLNKFHLIGYNFGIDDVELRLAKSFANGWPGEISAKAVGGRVGDGENGGGELVHRREKDSRRSSKMRGTSASTEG
jgi:hypothetical protein